ncbi:MAG: hypothetical protein ACOX5G_06490 [Kiritimatiellia bacterium]|jgi:hypothetical protein
MRVKDVLLLCAMLSAAGCLAQEPESYTKDYKHALRYGAKAKMTLRIVDDEGKPVSNAVATIQFTPPKATKYVIWDGISDSNGVVVAEGLTTQTVPGKVAKDGYYNSWFRFRSGDPNLHDNGGESSKIYYDSKAKDGRWLPWNPTIPVVLREIRNPIPMYVKLFEGKFPNGEVVGFDCEKGDFVSPYGSGDLADFTFRVLVSGDTHLAVKEISIDALDPDGGFVVSEANQSSAFKSEYFAPDYGYVTNLNASSSYGPEGFKGTVPYSGNSYLIFKSRVKRDSDGNVVSANYGKIYGELVYGRGEVELETAYVSFLYYFNPTPNDRNLEFDGKNNLFKPGWNSNLNWSREP